MDTITQRRDWAFSIAKEVATRKHIRVSDDLLKQFINFQLSHTTSGRGGVNTVNAWVNQYDKEYNRTGRRIDANNGGF